MTPEQLMQVWAATYAAEYVRLEAMRHTRPIEVSAWSVGTANRAVRSLQESDNTPTFEGYEKL